MWPHDALGHAGGAAGIAEDDIILAARPGAGRRMVEQAGIIDRAGDIGPRSICGGNRYLQQRQVVAHRPDHRRKFGTVNDAGAVGIAEKIPQFIGTVAVIDIERHRTKLAGGDKAFEIGRPVAEIQADLVAARHPMRGQARREPAAARVKLGIGQSGGTRDDRQPVGDRDRNRFEQIGKVELVGHHSICLAPARTPGEWSMTFATATICCFTIEPLAPETR